MILKPNSSPTLLLSALARTSAFALIALSATKPLLANPQGHSIATAGHDLSATQFAIQEITNTKTNGEPEATAGVSAYKGDAPKLQELFARFSVASTNRSSDLEFLATIEANALAMTRGLEGYTTADPALESFRTYIDETAAYQTLYLDFAQQLTEELSHARHALFPVAEAARTQVFADLGQSYLLGQNWVASPSTVGTTLTTVVTKEGSTGTVQQLQLLPYTVPGADLTDAPDFIFDALEPFNSDLLHGFHYSAVFNNSVAHTGSAVAIVDNGIPHLVYLPDTVTDSHSIFGAPLIASARSLSLGPNGLDWSLLFETLWPAFTPPTWSHDSTSDGVLRQSGHCESVKECLAAAEAAYNKKLEDAYKTYSKHVDDAYDRYSEEMEAMEDSIQGFENIFKQFGWPHVIDGHSLSDWHQYIIGLTQDSRNRLSGALADAEVNLKNAVCAAGQDFVDRVKDCIFECPEWEGLGAAMDDWLDQQGC